MAGPPGHGYVRTVGIDDGGCVTPGVDHVWALEEINLTLAGADRASVCARCGAPAYEPGQAAVADRRPPLDGGFAVT
jgi:hypothetical protein